MFKHGKIEIFRDRKREWRYRLKGRNGEIMAQSEGYRTRWSAKRGARRFQAVASEADIIEV